MQMIIVRNKWVRSINYSRNKYTKKSNTINGAIQTTIMGEILYTLI